jgi:hypothetical protein
VKGGSGEAVLQSTDKGEAQPGGTAAVEDRCQTTEDNERKTEGERKVNDWKEANVGGFKGKHCAGPYMDFDPILMAFDSYGATGVLTCNGK